MASVPKTRRRARRAPKLDHDQVFEKPIDEIFPSEANDEIYGQISRDDPDIVALAESIGERGILEPIVISEDDYIVSGHRRWHAARRAGLETVPCRVLRINRWDDEDGWLRLLVAFNGQRVKDAAVQFREEVVQSNPEEIYQALLAEREARLSLNVEPLDVRARSSARCKISRAKQPLLDAATEVIEDLREYWPLNDRQIHYQLATNYDVLLHASKPDSKYVNDDRSWRAVIDILTRGRFEGYIEQESLDDQTRPVQTFAVWRSPAQLVREHLDGFLKSYWRDPMQSQPDYVEIHCEKNTVFPSCKRAAQDYAIPVSSGRGFASVPCRREMLKRWKVSGKERLVILFATDLDPEGWQIPHSFARSLIDDFGVPESKIVAHRVALNQEHVERFGLPTKLNAKESSANYKTFVEETGSKHAYELEALPPDALEELIRDAIEGVIDRDLLNAEIAAEREDAAKLDAIRRRAKELLQTIAIDAE